MFTNQRGESLSMKQAKNKIIFPLDVPSLDAAKPYIQRLSGHVGMFKVGLELFIASGPKIIQTIKKSGADIFLDLKLHDIPVTVERAMAVIAQMGVSFVTVHCGENPEMLEAAVSGSRGQVGVLGVTVLTSVSGKDLASAGFQEAFSEDLSKLVLKRATRARTAGCRGVVCSGFEAAAIKKALGNQFAAVTPGIRPRWSIGEREDQKRIVTPAQAIRNGADYLVIGRPIRDARDPVAAAIRIAEEIRKEE
jgi:orotidine-5'-phosphate decarboxylase